MERGEEGPRPHSGRDVKKLRQYFFWFYATGGAFTPFQSLYLQNRGFSKAEIGLVLGLTQLFGAISIWVWGEIADRKEDKKRLVLGLILIAIVSALFAVKFNGWALVGILVLLAIVRDPVYSLSDCIAMEMTPEHYGSLRLGAPLGYAVAVTCAGFLYDGFSLVLLFPLQALIHFLAFLKARELDYQPRPQARERIPGFGWLFKCKELNAFFVFAAISYASLGYYSNFFSLLLRELGFSQGMVGIAYQIGVLAELPFLFWANHFTRKYSLKGLIGLSGLFHGVRWLLIGSNIGWIVFASQLLHGASYIVLYYAVVLWLDEVAGTQYKAAAQSFHALLASGAKIAGTSLGGLFAERWGVSEVFLALGGVMLAATVLWWLVDLRISQQKVVIQS